MNNKKLTICAFVLIVLIGAGYYFKNHIETQVVAEIQKTFAEEKVQYEKIDYDLLKNRLELTKLSSSQTQKNEVLTFSVDRLLVHDFNRTLFNETTEFPLVFANLTAENFKVDFENTQSTNVYSLIVDSLQIHEYKHNIPELIKQSEISTKSKDFYKALLNFAHQGIEFKNIDFSFIEAQKLVSQTKIAVLDVKQGKDNTKSSYSIQMLDSHLENSFTLKTNQVELKELQYPAIDNIAELLVIMSDEHFNLQLAMDSLPHILDEVFNYSHTKPFDTFALSGLLVDLQNKEYANAKLSLASSLVELDYDEDENQRRAIVSTKVKDLIHQSDFNELNSASLKKVLEAFNYSAINLNFENTASYDFNTKELKTKSFAYLPKLFDISQEQNIKYSNKDVWLFLLTGSPSFEALYSSDFSALLDNVSYKDIDLSLKDKGFIPMLIAYNAVENSISMQESLQGITNQISSLASMAQMGTRDLKDFSKSATEALIEQLESPNILELSIGFGKYVTADELFASLLFTNSVDVNFSINSTPGKSVLESIPQELQ